MRGEGGDAYRGRLAHHESGAADGSGVLCVAIVGGAVIPPLTGQLADSTGSLGLALVLPAVCYAVIAGFGLFARRSAKA